MKNWLQNYIAAQHRALDSVPLDAIARATETVRAAWREDRQIFAIGNGGSAANASHFATDLGKGASDKVGKRFRVLSLTDNVAWITALGNDYSYDDIFLRQLQNFARSGDVLGMKAIVSRGGGFREREGAKSTRLWRLSPVAGQRLGAVSSARCPPPASSSNEGFGQQRTGPRGQLL
jgi:D-sedoheptulose 7-phosphate isomerase